MAKKPKEPKPPVLEDQWGRFTDNSSEDFGKLVVAKDTGKEESER